jgi:hypothetical protein
VVGVYTFKMHTKQVGGWALPIVGWLKKKRLSNQNDTEEKLKRYTNTVKYECLPRLSARCNILIAHYLSFVHLIDRSSHRDCLLEHIPFLQSSKVKTW